MGVFLVFNLHTAGIDASVINDLKVYNFRYALMIIYQLCIEYVM
jgi:hypothetical protein